MRTQLSSDILEQQFGPTAVNVLYQDDAIRIIQTVSVETEQVLELSIVRFLPGGAQAFPEVHQAVVSGQSMGKAFRAANVAFRREEAFACKHTVPPALQQRFASDQPATIVGVRVLVGEQHIPYAEITETYTPSATWPHYSSQPTHQALRDLELLANYTTK